MGRNLVQVSDAHLKIHTFLVFDDFEWLISPHRWTTLAADSLSGAAVGDADNGIVALTTGATNNNEAGIRTTQKLYTIVANKTLVGEAYVQYAEAATNAANVAFGFASILSNVLVDDGAGPATNFSGFLIYKVDGGTVWKCVSSNGTTQTISTSTATAGSANYTKLHIEVTPVSSTVAEVSFYVDDQPLYDAAISNRNQPIKHQYTYTSAAAMYLVAGYVKDGSGTGETLNVDWAAWEKVR